MDKETILVTGIGGNVGQGIIRNIRRFGDKIRVIGCNVLEFSAGNHLCDSFYTVPYALESNYINRIAEIVEREAVQLIIPSTDYEAYCLTLNAREFSAVVVASHPQTLEIYLDKFLSSQHHNTFSIPFAETVLPSAYTGQYEQCIAKPRKGRGSRGLLLNPKDWSDLSDEDYVIQKYHKGEEITTAFYVTKANELLGFITLSRSLENGATSQCKVVSDYDEFIRPILLEMIKHGQFHGSANLQSIVSADGKIIPFEVNCRISGTNSIRSNFGFDDVKYTVQEYLWNSEPDLPKVTPGTAVRILMDVIYPSESNSLNCRDNSSPFYIF